MAIKIQNNTIIDDSRNITNANSVTFTGVTGTVGTTDERYLELRTNNTARVSISPVGNIGVGVVPSDTIPGFNTFVALGDSDTGIGQISDGIIGFATNFNERMRITGLGRVGIATTSPQHPLDVVGNIRYTGQLLSTVATGTAPFTVASNTVVANLNADLLDGLDSVSYSRLVCLTATGGSGAENGANTWTKIATFTTASEFTNAAIILAVSTINTPAMASAIVSAHFRTNATGSNPTVEVKMMARSGSSAHLADDAFKVISGGWNTPLELWMQKRLNIGRFAVYEISKSQSGGTLTYETNPGWQSATPTGAVTNVSTNGVEYSANISAPSFNATSGSFLGVASDTAATPSFTWSSDTTTGIWRVAANQVGITTGGTNRLVVNAAGVTTTVPVVVSNSIGVLTSANNLSISLSGDSRALTFTGGVGTVGTTDNQDLQFNTSGVARVAISKEGNVAIGATTSGIKLRVVDTNPNTGYKALSSFILTNNASGSANSSMRFGQVSNNRMFIESADGDNIKGDLLLQPYGGNVAIGRTAATSALDVDGDVSITDKIIHAGNVVTAIRFPSANTFTIETSGSERFRIDSNGALTATAAIPLFNIINTGAASTAQINFYGANSSPNIIGGINQLASGPMIISLDPDNVFDSTEFRVRTHGSDRFFVTDTVTRSVNDVLIGKTGLNYTIAGIWVESAGTIAATRAGGPSAIFNRNTSDGTQVEFKRNNTTVGSVSVTASATAFNTTSDYRLKDDLQPVNANAINDIRVYNFRFKDSDTRMDGVLAHELQDVIPYAVSGVKDETDDSGNPVFQQVDYSKLVPVLVASLQTAIADIQDLKRQIKNLEERL